MVSRPGLAVIPIVILAACFIVFAAVYVGAILIFGVPSDDERDKVRHGFVRLQQLVYVRRSVDPVARL
jgi:hypothetical protein